MEWMVENGMNAAFYSAPSPRAHRGGIPVIKKWKKQEMVFLVLLVSNEAPNSRAKKTGVGIRRLNNHLDIPHPT